LNTCKHLLDLALSGQGGMSDLEEMLPIVKRIGDTLAVLGIGEMRKQAMIQHEALTAIRDKGTFADGELIDVANGLANLENRLEAIAKGAGKTSDYANLDEREVEIDSAKHAVLMECRAGLELVKETIVESMSNQWNTSNLPRAVETLHHVQGGLLMVPLPRPAAIAEACSVYIRDQLSQRPALPGRELQTLAEAIASIDYFLERLIGGHGDDLDMYLSLAEEALGRLGYPLGSAPAASSELPAQSYAPEAEPPVAAAPVFESAKTESATAVAEVPTSTQYLSEEPHEDEDNPIDDEIIDIFVEEAADVLATLEEYVPRWADNMADEDAMVTVRRAFHTLKGSGRMVDAQDIGELAWSIENMLNRVLDRTFTPQSAHVRLIEQVLKVVPALVDAFKHRRPHPDPARCNQYIQWAQELSQGRVPVGLDYAGSYEDVPPPAAPEAVSEPVIAESPEENEDQVLWEIFASEAATHLAVVDGYIADMIAAAPLYSPPTDQLQRALHTLKGSAHMAAVTPIAAIMTPLETFIKELRSYQLRIDDDILQLLQDAAAYTREGLDCIYAHRPVVLSKQEQFVARVQELSELHLAPLIHLREIGDEGEHKAVDPRLLAIFMAEEMSLLLDADVLLARWRDAPDSLMGELPPLVNELQTLSEGARQANLPEMGGFVEQLKAIYSAVLDDHLTADDHFFSTMIAAHEKLLDMVDQVAAGQNIVPVSADLQAGLDALSLAGVEEPSEDAGFADFPFEEDAGFAAADFAATADEAAAKETPSDEEIGAFSPGEPLLLDELVETPLTQDEVPGQSWLSQENLLTENLPDAAQDDYSADSGAFADRDLTLGEAPVLDGELILDGELVSAEETAEAVPADAKSWPGAHSRLEEELPSSELLFDNQFATTDEVASEGASEASEEVVLEVQNEAFQGAEEDLSHAILDTSEDEEPIDFGSGEDDFTAADFLVEDEASADVGEPVEGDLLYVAEELYASEPVLIETEPSDVLAQEGAADGAFLPSVSVDFADFADEPGHSAVELTNGISGDSSLGIEESPEHILAEEDDLVFADVEEVSAEQPLFLDDEVEDTELFIAEEDDLVVDDEDAFEPDENLEVLDDATGLVGAALTTEVSAPEVTATRAPIISAAQHLDTAFIEADDFDPDILEIFLEEAAELIEEMDEAIHDWESDWTSRDAPDTMKRALHTLKGGARLAGLKNLGELAHEYESFLMVSTDPSSDPRYFQTLLSYQDQVLNGVRGVRARLDGEPAPEPVVAPTPRPAPVAASTPVAPAAELVGVVDGGFGRLFRDQHLVEGFGNGRGSLRRLKLHVIH